MNKLSPAQFVSTRQNCPAVSFSQALEGGLAPDGGLYLPQVIPRADLSRFSKNLNLPEFAVQVLAPFFEGDLLEPHLLEICSKTFSFPIPLRELNGPTLLLELFHGPTAAFKDVAARFLAECISHSSPDSIDSFQSTNPLISINLVDKRRRIVLVATSGDTGSAIAAAFDNHHDTSVYILYPKGRVSPRQEQMLTCWSSHVHALAVEGTFDDCQRVVKEALSNSQLRNKYSFISANSISVGRLLPQMIYYAWSSMIYQRTYNFAPGFIIPTGNLGNGFAAVLAREMGFPIREIIFATNANKAIPNYFETGKVVGFPTQATLANAMDVGLPSNLERLAFFFPQIKPLKDFVSTHSSSDQAIQEVIKNRNWGQVFCPHTATAVDAFLHQPRSDWIIVATAHPAKFETIIEPLISEKNSPSKFVVPVPSQMEDLLNRPRRSITIPGTLEGLMNNLFNSH